MPARETNQERYVKMLKTLSLLLNSRKAWAGAFSVLGVLVATFLRSHDKIPEDATLPLILGISGLGTAFMVSTGIEDSAKHLRRPKTPDDPAPLHPSKRP